MMKNTALITGASSGIGRDLAHIHAENGGDLVVIARRKEKLEALKQELEQKHGIHVKIIAKDLASAEAAKEIYDELSQEKIAIDILINNAGFGGVGLFHERKWETDKTMIELNVMALTALTRYFLPHMVERKNGKILNVASTAGFMPGPLQAVYFATKSYVISFSQAIAQEVKDSGVTVTALCPAATKTEFGERSGMKDTKMFNNPASSRKVAEKGYRAMQKGKLIEITEGALGFMINWILPLMPRKAILKMVYKMQQK